MGVVGGEGASVEVPGVARAGDGEPGVAVFELGGARVGQGDVQPRRDEDGAGGGGQS